MGVLEKYCHKKLNFLRWLAPHFEPTDKPFSVAQTDFGDVHLLQKRRAPL